MSVRDRMANRSFVVACGQGMLHSLLLFSFSFFFFFFCFAFSSFDYFHNDIATKIRDPNVYAPPYGPASSLSELSEIICV